ncbi:hypothetical protein G7Y89_g12763 [Cudoniella acicularis]|uniref:MYND-type domain-containing protein n=1 Tax=Cudoniella acicularis TaxID=354080 RepID=A0A8H4RAX1_9HELO|nr:hypothetical protein G7Y89_g12763 [Cudoniella acicularis]
MESQTQVVETPRHVVETPHRVVSKSSDCSTDSEMSEPLVINTNRSVESQVIEQLATAKIEALQAPIWSTSNPRLVSDPALANITPVSDGDSEDEDEDDDFEVRAEWLGTSQYYRDYGLELQARGELEPLISYRDFLAKDLSRTPYNPSLYITLCAIDNDLGFTDISAANAYRALILIECGLNITLFLSFADLGEKVRAALATRLHTSSAIIIEDELEDLRKQAYRELLEGLLGCGAFWDGLKEAKKALQLAPTDPAILKSRHNLKLGFEDRHVGLKGLGATPSELRSLTRTGKIFQIKYPWLDEKLYMRTPALLRTVNRSLLDSSCEVRPVVFGTPLPNTLAQKPAPKAEGEDVGPLGIFATRDIKEGEVILVDKSITSVSDVPPSAHGYCDACHACLLPPYLHPRDVIRPSCCKLVAFCSKACYEIASSGYHSILCGKDIDWIYEPDSMLSSASSEAGNAGTAFRPVLFTRLLAVVLASNKQTSAKSSISTSIKDHPLQHPVIARMAANYAPPSKGIPDHTYGWQYYENVIAPTKMLLQLGIDIFKTRDWDPEVIQTIFWRMENNANAGNPSMFPSSETPASEIPETFKAPPLPPRLCPECQLAWWRSLREGGIGMG